jgi:hypothetical protein
MSDAAVSASSTIMSRASTALAAAAPRPGRSIATVNPAPHGAGERHQPRRRRLERERNTVARQQPRAAERVGPALGAGPQ